MAIAPWIAPAVLAEYVHNAGVRLRRQFRGHTRHPGDAAAIIEACIERCWNGRTFTASPGHFDMFWTRDLSFSVPSLVRLGYGDARPRLAGVRARRLDPAAQPHHDDDPLLRPPGRRLRVRRRLAAAPPGRAAGRRRHRPRRPPPAWLQAEVAHYYDRVVDPATGLVRSDRKFSAHRDTVVNRSNAYGNTMVALLAKTIEETGWFDSPFERHFEGDYGRLLIEHFWAGDHFRDALGDETVSGEANVWPFYTGVIADPDLMRPGPRLPRRQRLLRPVPAALRDHPPTRARGLADPPRPARLPGQHRLDQPRRDVPAGPAHGRSRARGERDEPLRRVDRARRDVLGGHDRHGRNWVSPRWIMIGEESMLWSAIFLDVLRTGADAPALLSPATKATEVLAAA